MYCYVFVFLSIFLDLPEPPKDLMYVATLYNITLHWKYQLFGSGSNVGILIDVRKRNELEILRTVTRIGSITSFVLLEMEPFNDYILTFYVTSSIGRSYPRALKTTTYFRSKLFICVYSLYRLVILFLGCSDQLLNISYPYYSRVHIHAEFTCS